MADEEMRQRAAVAALFARAQGFALAGEPLPNVLKAQIKFLVSA